MCMINNSQYVQYIHVMNPLLYLHMYVSYTLQLIHLLVGLCQSLSYEPSPPKDSVVHIPSSERADLIRERRKVCINAY